MNVLLWFCLLVFCHWSSGQILPWQSLAECPQNNKTNLKFLFMGSSGVAFNSLGSVVGSMIALERINANNSILKDYTLSYSAIEDTKCDRETSLSLFLNHVRQRCPGIIAIIGAGCSTATEPVAELSNFWGLPLIGYVSSSTSLNLRDYYHNFFRLHPTEENDLLAIVGTILHYGWKQISIITQAEPIFIKNKEDITALLKAENITVLESEDILTDEDPATKNGIFPENTRIFFLNMYEDKARQVICQAHMLGLYGKNYQWLLFGWYSVEWWNKRSDNFTCCKIDLADVLEKSLAVQQYPIAEDRNKKAVGELSYNKFQKIYHQRLGNTGYNEAYSAHIVYDAVWALAFALERTIKRIEDNNVTGCEHYGNETIPLSEWEYTCTTTSCILHQSLGETNFFGLSGMVKLNENGTRINKPVRILQFRSGSYVQVAEFTDVVHYDYLYVNNENDSTVFPDGIPWDGVPISNIIGLKIELTIVCYLLSLVGLFFSIFCLVFTILFRNRKVIRLTSPTLNYCILAGTSMIFLSIFFHTHSSTDFLVWTAFCYIIVFLDSFGYTLAFATILAKVWRLYYIFHNPTTKKKTITDWHLFIIIAVLTVGMALLLLIGFVIPATRLDPNLITNLEKPFTIDDDGIKHSNWIYTCIRPAALPWIICLYLYIGAIQLAALVLAIQTRKVRIKPLNDTKEITAIIYVTSIILIELAVVSFILNGYNNAREVHYSVVLLIDSFFILSSTFIPKMVRLYKDPNGDKIFTDPDSSSVIVGKNGAITWINDKMHISNLEAKISELESKMKNSLVLSTDNLASITIAEQTPVFPGSDPS